MLKGSGIPEAGITVPRCVQGTTVFDMRYLATIVANCFLAFGEILQMNTRVQELSAGVARVAQVLHTTEVAEGLQRELTATNISGCCPSGLTRRCLLAPGSTFATCPACAPWMLPFFQTSRAYVAVHAQTLSVLATESAFGWLCLSAIKKV